VFVLRGFWDELDRRGVSLAELERHSGVVRPRRDDFTTTVSKQDVHRLFEVAVALTGDETLGLTMGPPACSMSASLHLLGHLIMASVTLRDAIALATRAGPHWREPAIEELAQGRVRIGFYSDEESSAGTCVQSQFVGVYLFDIARQFLHGESETPVVQLDFPAPADVSAYQRAFPGGVQFSTDGTFINLPSRVLDQRRSGADPALAQQLLRLAQDQYCAPENDDWTRRVRRALRANAASRLEEPSMIAAQLGVSARGLWRRLASEGTSFSTLINEALYERAQLLLSRPQATSAAVAEALGYAELSSFHRAFRRWSGGLTPNEYRQRHVDPLRRS
jgi:AraC-like DNA-binding protein